MALFIKLKEKIYIDKSHTIDTFRNEIRYSTDGFVSIDDGTNNPVVVNIKHIIEFYDMG